MHAWHWGKSVDLNNFVADQILVFSCCTQWASNYQKGLSFPVVVENIKY